MFSRLSYVGRETWASLRRNVTLTVAALLTIAVSLSLFGIWLLAQRAVSHTTQQWKGGVEFIVFMNPDATQDQIDAVGRDLRDNPQVEAALPRLARARQHDDAVVDAHELPRGACHRRGRRHRRHRTAVPEESRRLERDLRQGRGAVDLH